MPKITGKLTTTDPSDQYAITDDLTHQGGFRPVADIADRDAITLPRRSEGMRAKALAEDIEYEMGPGTLDNADWIPYVPIKGITSVKLYEAKGDSATSDTLAIQASIDNCADGTVFLPPGIYRSGPLYLKRGITIHGASLWNTQIKVIEDTLSSGLLVVGRQYRIASRTDGDFVSAGAADNNVGTKFTATTTGIGLLDAGDTVIPIGFLFNFNGHAYGATISSGLLVVGRTYKISTRTDGDFVSAGAANNNVGTIFTATTTGVGLLDAGDTVTEYSQQDQELNMAPTTIRDLFLEGNNRTPDMGGIFLEHTDYMLVENILIWRFSRTGLHLEQNVRESTFRRVLIRYCGNKDATDNHGAGWPGLSVVDYKSSVLSTDDVHNGLHFDNCQVVYCLGDHVVVDTAQIPNNGRRVTRIAFTDNWFHGYQAIWAVPASVQYGDIMGASPTMQAYNLMRVGCAYDVKIIGNRLSWSGLGKAQIELSTSTMGGAAPPAGLLLTYDPEGVSVTDNFHNGNWIGFPFNPDEVSIYAKNGFGHISRNQTYGKSGPFKRGEGWKDMDSSIPSDRGLTFSQKIGSYAGGNMAAVNTDPFTIYFKVHIKEVIPSVSPGVFGIGQSDGGSGSLGCGFYQSTNGNISFQFFGATTSDYRLATIPFNYLQSLMGKVVEFAITRDAAGVLKIYVNGGAIIYLESTGGTPPAWSASVSSNKWNLGVHQSFQPGNTTIQEFKIANRALSADDVNLLTFGTAISDRWATMDVKSSGLLTVGARYRIITRTDGDFVASGAASNVEGTEFIATNTGSGLLDAGDTVRKIGWLLDLDLDGGAGTAVLDRTSNNYDGFLVGPGAKWSRPIGSSGSGVALDIPDRGVTFDSTISSTSVTGALQTVAANPFSVHIRVRMPSSLPSTGAGLFTLSDTSGGVGFFGCGLALLSSGVMQFIIYEGTVNDARFATIAEDAVSGWLGSLIDFVITRDGAQLIIYANGAIVPFSEFAIGTSPGWDLSLVTPFWNVGAFTSTQIWSSTVLLFRVANRVLTALESARMNFGVRPNDMWGSLTVLASGLLTVGKRYRIVSRTDGDFVAAGAANNTVGTEFIATNTGSGLLDAGDTAMALGWIVDVDLTSGSALDRSTNANHGALVGNGVSWTLNTGPNLDGALTITNEANATFTWTPLVSKSTTVLTAVLTAGKTATLSSTNAKPGTRSRWVRTAASTGAFNWDIGGLINLTPATWVEVEYTGAGHVVVQYGALTAAAGAGVAASDSPTWTGAHVFSKAGAVSLPTIAVTGAAYALGTTTTSKPLVLIETAGATSAAWNALGTLLGVNTPSGFAGRIVDFQANGVSCFNISQSGTITIVGNLLSAGNLIAGAALNLSWNGRSEMLSPADGTILLQNAANSDFTALEFGGSTSSFPEIARSGTGFILRLADGTAGGKLAVSLPLAKVGGRIKEFYTGVGTPASTVETDLHSFTTIANTFDTDGQSIVARYAGVITANASASSRLRVYFAGTVIFDSGAIVIATTGSYVINVFGIRNSSSGVRFVVDMVALGAITIPLVTCTDVAGLTLTGTNILKTTGQGGGASPVVNDIVERIGFIDWFPVST